MCILDHSGRHAGSPWIGVLRRGEPGLYRSLRGCRLNESFGSPFADVRSRYERLFRERQAAEQRAAGEGGSAAPAPPPIAPFQASISPAFTKHLS